jgi:hypothetical protein
MSDHLPSSTSIFLKAYYERYRYIVVDVTGSVTWKSADAVTEEVPKCLKVKHTPSELLIVDWYRCKVLPTNSPYDTGLVCRCSFWTHVSSTCPHSHEETTIVQRLIIIQIYSFVT